MRLLLQIPHFYKEVDLIGQTCVCLQISALSRRKPSPWLTLPWTAGTTPLEKKNDFRLCAKAPPLPREMHFHTSQTITPSHFPHRHGDNANRGKKRLSLECHKVPPLPREMHFHTSQNITFSHFPHRQRGWQHYRKKTTFAWVPQSPTAATRNALSHVTKHHLFSLSP